jgi:Tol biopolymer transport system component
LELFMLKLIHCSAIGMVAVLGVPLEALSEQSVEAALLANTRQLTFAGKRAGEGYFSADGTRMVFQSERDPDNPFYQIYVLDLATGDVERVSPGVGKTTCAWLHPSGQRVLYASTHEDPEAVAKMQAELDFRASGQERRYAWDYDEHFDIYAQAFTGGEPANLTATLGYDAEGAYSPDGKQIVFASNRRAYTAEMTAEEAAVFEQDKASMMDLYLMDSDGANVRRLTDAPGYDGGPFFSADGSKITWRRFAKNGASAEIYSMDLATGEARQLTRMGAVSWAPFFHPSGDYLVFASNREGIANFELFLVDAAGARPPVRVTHTPGFDGLPVFSPDGARLSWTSNRGAKPGSQIFLADWNDAAARRLLGLKPRQATRQGQRDRADLDGTDQAVSAADARRHVERLASVEMAGRLTGTEGERRASAYVASVLEQLGLEPGGGAGSYFQDFDFTAGVRLGDANALQLTLGEHLERPVLNEDWRPLAFSSTGEIAPAGVVFAGYGIVAPGVNQVPAYDSYGALDVAGKWVMVLRFQPEQVPPEWRRHLVHYSDLAFKASIAKREGAIGLLVATGPNARARDRLVALKFEASATGTGVAGVALSDAVADRLLAAAGKDLQALQDKLDHGKAMAGFDLPGVRVGARVDIVSERRAGRNVLARLKAEGAPPAPPVVLGAHLDHLGRGETSGSLALDEERDGIHYGADDNASGVAAMLEVAQYLAGLAAQGKLNAKRDIVFAAWSGEELGSLGSSHYVDRLAGEGDLKGKVAAYLNMDMVGRLRQETFVQGTGSSRVWAQEIERRNAPIGLALTLQADPYLPTDATPFYMQGIPVLNLFTGAHEDYSSPRDTPDRLNYEGIRDIARFMAGLVRSVARAEEPPDYQAVTRQRSGLGRKHLRAYLGTIPAYGQDERVTGVKLQGAVKGGPAAAAGVAEGDVLVELAGTKVENIHDFMAALSGLKAGEATDLVVVRDGKRVRLPVMPGARE